MRFLVSAAKIETAFADWHSELGTSAANKGKIERSSPALKFGLPFFAQRLACARLSTAFGFGEGFDL